MGRYGNDFKNLAIPLGERVRVSHAILDAIMDGCTVQAQGVTTLGNRKWKRYYSVKRWGGLWIVIYDEQDTENGVIINNIEVTLVSRE